jgi:hypothetical protein
LDDIDFSVPPGLQGMPERTTFMTDRLNSSSPFAAAAHSERIV